MLTNIFNLIVQLWELGLFIIRWFDKNISVGWLAFGLAVLTFLRNNQKKLLQRFEYSSFICEFKTTITVYNNSLGTETSRFVGILVTNKKTTGIKKYYFLG
jgi:hypothetical protein